MIHCNVYFKQGVRVKIMKYFISECCLEMSLMVMVNLRGGSMVSKQLHVCIGLDTVHSMGRTHASYVPLL